MNFSSDNIAGAHEAIAASLIKNANGVTTPYGASELDKKLETRFAGIFQTELDVFFVGTGTAANALAIAACAKPGGIALAHEAAHIIVDECGAPELFSSNRLKGIRGENGKIDPGALENTLKEFEPAFVHYGQPSLVSISQLSEAGTAYTLNEIGAISTLAKNHNLPLHMDGARFANALIALEASPAEMSWQVGIDLLSFGGTKNGCWCAEALVCFDRKLAKDIGFLRKRAGHLFSKSRFIAAQFEAYFADGLWLDLARHSNQMAEKLADAITGSNMARLAWRNDANELFVVMEQKLAEDLHKKGAQFYQWHAVPADLEFQKKGEKLYRLVTSFATRPEEIDDFIACLKLF